MANTLGSIKAPSATATIRKNGVAAATKSGAMIPFYRVFGQGKSTPAPPAKWLTRK